MMKDNTKDREFDKFEETSDGQTAIRVIVKDSAESQKYTTHEVAESGAITYVGKIKPNGVWLIQRITDTSGNLSLDYANESNNVAYPDFSGAWTDRASLTYDLISNLTGL